MTMADTVAVMNAGRIEQLGAPAELYESPVTTFVANFLGQSNLISGRPGDRSGDAVRVECHGQHVLLPAERNRASGSDVLVGVRPEKIRMEPAADGARPGAVRDDAPPGGTGQAANRLVGGVISDASFTGVSTQYLVRMPWGQELTVFAQNLGVGERYGPGTAVDLCWEPGHTFALTGDAEAGSEVEDAPLGVGAG
jgi:spermidine/putrescine transport system ATP-binding protein